MNKKSILFSIMLFSASLLTRAEVKLPSLIADDMVMQQKSDVRLWGWATPGEKVSVKSSWGATASATADKDGRWLTKIHTPEASYQEQTLTIGSQEQGKKKSQAGNGEVTMRVLIGEVWLATGQSNMEMPLKGFGGACVKNGASDAMHAMQESPYVRMYNVERRQTFTRQECCNGKWLTPTFDNALEYSATAYYFASALSNALQVPVGIVNCSYGGTRVESWSSAETCREYPDVPQDSIGVFGAGRPSYERPLVTYNAMFWPIRQYTYKGIIWYQGCGNVADWQNYSYRLQRMVEQWRKELDLGTLPFYQVQIAPYDYGEQGKAPRLREQQEKACSMIPNSDIICTNDLAESFERFNIHPREKRAVGLRLSLLALNQTYGRKEIPCHGPHYDPQKTRISGDTITVGVTTNNYGICRNYDIKGFEIAGEDRVFHPANANFNWRDNSFSLTSPEVKNPVAARYCFRDFQIGNVIGGYELPLMPFRTDDW